MSWVGTIVATVLGMTANEIANEIRADYATEDWEDDTYRTRRGRLAWIREVAEDRVGELPLTTAEDAAMIEEVCLALESWESDIGRCYREAIEK